MKNALISAKNENSVNEKREKTCTFINKERAQQQQPMNLIVT